MQSVEVNEAIAAITFEDKIAELWPREVHIESWEWAEKRLQERYGDVVLLLISSQYEVGERFQALVRGTCASIEETPEVLGYMLVFQLKEKIDAKR